jgi:hypothetical protein
VSGNSRQLNQGVAANKDTRLYQPKAGAVTEGTSNQGGNQPQPQEVLDKAAGKAAEEKREVVPKAVNLDENHIVEAPKENLQGVQLLQARVMRMIAGERKPKYNSHPEGQIHLTSPDAEFWALN